jgi:hypothetical protein
MNKKSPDRIAVLHELRNFTRRQAAFAVLLALPLAAGAQDVIMPAPSFSVTPPAIQESEANNEMIVFRPETTTQPAQPFQYGIFNLRPHPYYRFLYGAGILAGTNQAVNTVINQISPGFLLEIGKHWTLDYTPTWTFYSSSQFKDSLDHSITLTGGTSYEDWTLGLSQNISLTSDPLVETATQTDQQNYTTALKASYLINSKLFMDLGLYQHIISADQFNSSREWSTLDWLNYQFWPRMSAGIGAGFGYVDVDTGPDMTYEQLQARTDWRATDKISLQVHGGGEDRQFLDGASDLLNFVFGASRQYQPFTTTKISISANREVSPSYFTGATENTELTAGLNQRLLGKLYLDLQGGYHNVKYVTSQSNVPVNRDDDIYSVSVQLSYRFIERGSVAAFYQASKDSSSQPGFSYSSSQVGFQISYSF